MASDNAQTDRKGPKGSIEAPNSASPNASLNAVTVDNETGPDLQDVLAEKSSGKTTPLAGDATAVVEADAVYPSGPRLLIILIALILGIFMVALDMSIVATAIPKITDEFQSLDEFGWYGSAFFVALSAFQSTWGKLYKYFPLKPVFLASSSVFEIGSLICALSPNSTALIVGRAIQGWGAAGLLTGSYMIIAYTAPPRQRPAYTGILGAVFGCSSVAGPLLGGVFTDRTTWRWCFWINLPIGGATILMILLFYRTPAHARPVAASAREKLLQMDIPGTALIIAAQVLFLLAMQWGGVTKSWGSGAVVAALVLSAVLLVVFALVEVFQGERSLLVPRLLKQRNTAACCVFIFFLNGANFLFVYFLPLYFQSIHNLSASDSGIRNIPLIVTTSFVSCFLGASIGLVGYFQPFMTASGVLSAIGAGLLYSLDVDSSTGSYLGYQAVIGVGLGLGIQAPVIAVQALSPPEDLGPNTAIILFFQLIGGAIFVSTAENIFSNRLLESVPLLTKWGVDPTAVLNAGASGIAAKFNPEDIPAILASYMIGLKAAWALGVALAVAAVFASLGPERRNIKEGSKEYICPRRLELSL